MFPYQHYVIVGKRGLFLVAFREGQRVSPQNKDVKVHGCEK